MSEKARKALAEEISKVVNRFRMEWEITYVEVVGVLEFVKAEIIQEGLEAAEDEEDA